MIMESVKPGCKEDSTEQLEQGKIYLEKRRTDIETLLERPDQLSEEARQRLTIEAKFIGVRDVYQKVYWKIVEGMKRDSRACRLFERKLLDRNYFRREKLQRTRDTGSKVENLENQMKSDHERRKKIKHREFMQHLRTHKEEFFEWHRKKQRDRKKVVNQAKANYDAKKKSKEDNDNKEYEKRLKILQAQDMPRYFEALKEAKDTKIS